MFSGAFSAVLLILFIVFFVYLAQFLAKKKGLDATYWGVMGGIFGPLVIPVLLLMKSKKTETDSK